MLLVPQNTLWYPAKFRDPPEVSKCLCTTPSRAVFESIQWRNERSQVFHCRWGLLFSSPSSFHIPPLPRLVLATPTHTHPAQSRPSEMAVFSILYLSMHVSEISLDP